MPRVKFKGSNARGAFLNVAEGSPILTDPKYEVIPETNQAPVNKVEQNKPILDQTVRRYPTIDDGIGTLSDRIASFFGNLDRTAPDATERDKVREEFRTNAQSQIDLINTKFADIIAQEKEEAVDRSEQTRSIVSRGGLIGSPRGQAIKGKTTAFNKEVLRRRQDEQQAEINVVLGRADERAREEIRLRTTEAKENAEKFIGFLQTQQTEAREDIKVLAGSGLDINDLSDEQYSNLLKQTGWSPLMFDMQYDASKPEELQTEWNKTPFKLSDGRVLFTGITPDGQMIHKEYEYDIPEESELKIIDGVPYFLNKDENGKEVLEQAEGFEDQSEKKLVLKLLEKYPDAGIDPVDTLAQAQSKLKNSRIYRKEIRASGSGGVGGAGLTTAKLATAKANYLKANQKKTEDDFNALSNEEKLVWSVGGPEGGENTTQEVDFYADEIIEGNENFIDEDGNIKWSSIPKELRSDVNKKIDEFFESQPKKESKPWYQQEWIGKIPKLPTFGELKDKFGT